MEVLSGQRSATSLGEGTCGREIKVLFTVIYSDLLTALFLGNLITGR